MKPKDLKHPFRWEDRRPCLHQKVLFVPDYYDKHKEWSFPDFAEIFENTAPVNIEFCTGNGTWIAEKAKESAENWVAVEWRFDRVRKIWSKMSNLGLKNLLTVCGEAFVFARDYLPPGSIASAFINFPDPWPKGKHAKNRLLQAPFVQELSRIVQKSVTIVTDDLTYAEQIQGVMAQDSSWKKPLHTHEWPGYGASYFDTLWREKGKTIHYFHYERNQT